MFKFWSLFVHIYITVKTNSVFFLFCFWRESPPVGQGLLNHEVFRSHKTTHNRRQDSSGRVISPSQRPLPENTQQFQQTNIHAPGGIGTHNLSRRAAADRLRQRGHWDRQFPLLKDHNYLLFRNCETSLFHSSKVPEKIREFEPGISG